MEPAGSAQGIVSDGVIFCLLSAGPASCAGVPFVHALAVTCGYRDMKNHSQLAQGISVQIVTAAMMSPDIWVIGQ